MANGHYTHYRNGMLGLAAAAGSVIDWDDDTIFGVLCTADYTPDLAGDTYLTDIPNPAQIVAAEITGITVDDGRVKVSGTVTFTPASTGDVLTQLVIYKDTGTPSTSPLAVYFDTFTSGMPVTTASGTGIDFNFNVSGIFKF